MLTTIHIDQNASPPGVEVITSAQRRRHWPSAEKVRLVGETMQHWMSVSYVARRAGVAPACCSTGIGECWKAAANAAG
jgi:transposase